MPENQTKGKDMSDTKSKKSTLEVYEGSKVEGSVDKSKAIKGVNILPKDEVGGRSVPITINCPYCGALNYVTLDYEGENIICWNDHMVFRAYV
jgi:hypothetical protein